MPRLVRWFIKAAFVWLVAALIVRILIAFSAGTLVSGLNPVSWHMFLVGWLTQLIFGVAHWMFPTLRTSEQARMRGKEALMAAVWVLLNVGLLLRVVAEPLQAARPAPLWASALLVSALLQWLAGVGFVWNTWPRVRPPRRTPRKA